MSKMKKAKDNKGLDYYLNLPWTYTIETESPEGSNYYVIRVNELPGICTCAVEIYHEKGESVPEPIDRDHFKGKILYRTDSERHYLIAKTAQRMHKSISKTLDALIDKGLEQLRAG